MPLSKKFVSCLNILLHNLEQINRLLSLFEFLDGYQALFARLDYTHLHNHLIPHFSIPGHVSARWWQAVLFRSFYAAIFLATILPYGHSILGLLNVHIWE